MQQMDVKKVDGNLTLLGVDYLGDEDIEKNVFEFIEEKKPDKVGIAICETRFETLKGDGSWKEKPLLPTYKKGKIGPLIYQTFVDSINENLRQFKNIEPEIHVARLVPFMDKLNTDVEFIDRDITLTLGTAYQNMSIFEKLKMVKYLKSTMLSFSGKKKSDSVDNIKHHDDLVEGVLEKLEMFAPSVANKARKERKEYMAKMLYGFSKSGTVVAVLPKSKIYDVFKEVNRLKMEERFKGESSSVKHLENIGKKVYSKVIRYASSIFFIALAIYLFLFSDVLNIWRAWLYWFLAVGGMSALGSALVKGHPFSIIISFLLAPFMSLTLHGPGWIAGYVELKVRNPTMADVKNLTACRNASEFLSNNVIKVFLVGTFSNIFTWLGLFIILPLLIRFAG
ncbi:MAG: TraB family protein [Candidatus Saliniplasma sp.]